MKVKVYWNSIKKLYSVIYKRKLYIKSTNLILVDCKFKVSKKGRERVLREKSKSVHAYIEGNIVFDNKKYSKINTFNSELTYPTYDPYKNETFVDRYSKVPIYEADFVIFETVNNSSFIRAYKQYEQSQVIASTGIRKIA